MLIVRGKRTAATRFFLPLSGYITKNGGDYERTWYSKMAEDYRGSGEKWPHGVSVCADHNIKPTDFNQHRKELEQFLKSNLFVDLGAPLHLFKSAPELSGRLTFDGIMRKVARMDKFQLAKILEIIAAVRLEVPLVRNFPPSNDLEVIRKDSRDFSPVATELNSGNL